ncbi:MAG TPA: nucleotidyltransferase domain-containing protein [Actinocrinis sp.]|nr:nucleotidyltransferase domain-containing protein [Actinocrinis sp.]
MIQERMIQRVREVCAADDGLDAALMYGSFAAGEADEHSDIEFWLFFTPPRLAEIDPRAWCAQIAPVSHGLTNEFGTYVAFFPGLVRGEFHFAAQDQIREVGTWPARGAAVERMVVVDRSGELAPVLRALPERFVPTEHGGDVLGRCCDPFANWLVLAHHLAARGEHLRAWDALGHVQRYLLWMARLAESSAAHWLTLSRGAERELSPGTVAALRAATCAATPEALPGALRAALELGRSLWLALAAQYGRPAPTELFAEIEAALAG